MSGEIKEVTHIEERKVIKEKSKIGHRRINDQGTVTYKKKTTSEIQKALQLGIRISVTLAHNKTKRDMLLKDFGVVETLSFPRTGGKDTPPHDLSDFTFKTFAPIAFRYFRDFFRVDISDYLNSICHQELRELSNAGASGSIFYITRDDEFIIKTVQHKEASFLQKLLPEYYINLIQHPRTLLPKFYGLYCYQTMGKNIRFVIMNNLLPSIKIHEKYDLKGSTYKRIASATEKSKSSPTLKDLDFRENHDDGLYLEVETYEALLNTIQRDCRVLESFSIMDYSLLLGIHNLDQSLRQKKETGTLTTPILVNNTKESMISDDGSVQTNNDDKLEGHFPIHRKVSPRPEDKEDQLNGEPEANIQLNQEPEAVNIALKESVKLDSSGSNSTETYFTPASSDNDSGNSIQTVNEPDSSNDKFRTLPQYLRNSHKMLASFYRKSNSAEELSMSSVATKKVSFMTKLYPIGSQIKYMMSFRPTPLLKKAGHCVEQVIRNTWMECDMDLYSYLPPVAVLSSGSTDDTVLDSDIDISSIATDIGAHYDVFRSDPNKVQGNQSNAANVRISAEPIRIDNAQNVNQSKELFTRQRSRSRSTRRIAAYSTVLESIQAPADPVDLQNSDEEAIPAGGIPARNKLGDRLILFMGIIDILQSYQFLKRMEHNMKAIFLDAETISVTNPTFYAQRFQDFFGNVVFTKIPSPMRQNPDRKRSSIRKEIYDKGKVTQSRTSYDNTMPDIAEAAQGEGDQDEMPPEKIASNITFKDV